MKNLLFKITIAASVVMALCISSFHANATVPEGYKTIQVGSFQVSIPAEFEKSEGWSSESQMSFNSNAVNVRDDGDEYLSSVTFNVYETEGDITELNEYAENMKGSAMAMEEKVEDPIIEGNTIIMRSTVDFDEEYYYVNWRFVVFGENGKVAGGTISYHCGDAKFYDGIVTPIIQSIEFK